MNLKTHPATTFGRRNFVDVIDEIASSEPSRPVVFLPRSANAEDGWEDLSFGKYANSINRFAQWIVERAGHAKDGDYPTVAYIGPNDIRYLIVLAAPIKAGYKALFISPRNNIESQLSLFQATDCHWIIHTPEYTKVVESWLSARPMKSSLIDSISDILSDEHVPSFPYQKPFDEIRTKPAFVLHTSGSTGTPKPIICRHGILSLADAYHQRPEFTGYSHIMKAFSEMGSKVLCTMPFFHALGLYYYISLSIFWGTPLVLPIADQAVTPDTVYSFINNSGADAAVLAPSLLQDMSHDNNDMNLLAALSFVTCGGGGLEVEAGDRLVEAGVTLANIISTTEYGLYPIYFQPDMKLWRYFVFDDETFGSDYRPTGDDTFEHVIVRRAQDPGMQGIFYTFPELNEYHTNDLYKPHPTFPHLWLHSGRSDDVIVFSNGEKLNPVSIESVVGAHPDLKRAVVVGQGKFQAGIFLEPHEIPNDDAAVRALIDNVWPTIEQVNKQTVAHGQIAKHLVKICDPTKAIPSSAKGSLQRGAFLKLYIDEIENMYEGNDAAGVARLSLESEDALMKSLHDIIITQLGVEDIMPDADFFEAGIDSLGIINLSKILGDGLRHSGVSEDCCVVTTRVIYGNSSLRRLARNLFVRISQSQVVADGNDGVEAANALLKKYSIESIDSTIPDKPSPKDNGQTIILTGSTGSLGSYLLDLLEGCDSVSKVICLNRSADGGCMKQLQSNAERGLLVEFPKTEFLRADLSQEMFGLDSVIYDRLLLSVDRVIHNAWPVNFNLSVESFDSSIHGVKRLADFSFHATKCVPIVFLSSVGSVDRWAEPEPVPEALLTNLGLASMGYGQSKFVGDLILQQARDKLGVPSAVVRVGQISGPRNGKGAWNKQEWLPTIISSSIRLGQLPTDLGANSAIDWVPVEDVAMIVLEIAGILSCHPLSEISGHFHIVNPAHAQWRDLGESVKSFYEEQGHPMVSVDMATWVKTVEATSSENGSEIPAVKLLDAYKGLIAEKPHHPGFSTTKTRGFSKTLDRLAPVNAEMMRAWCKEWSF
ncbi:unnamed protein product [Penicillium pancosmium]